jgi:transcriptional repressor NrdR
MAPGTVTAMWCPACGDLEDRVVDSRQADDGRSIRRRRECANCGTRFTTFERVETPKVTVRKRDGSSQPFDREKVAAGITHACKARPVMLDVIDDLVTAIEDEVRSWAAVRGEVGADDIGQEVLRRLRSLDGVAAVRFASVYKGFEDVDDFAREVGLLQHPAEGGRAPLGQLDGTR